MTTQLSRIDIAQFVRRGLAAGALAAMLAGLAAPAQPAAAAGCGACDDDFDGLTNYQEYAVYGTDLANPDTDGDLNLDGDEVFNLGTDPLVFDRPASDPRTAGVIDRDLDGLQDVDELNVYGSDPLNADTDFDGLSDGAEVAYPSNPLYPDTDGDGVLDGAESAAGTDLLDPASAPALIGGAG